MDKKLKNLFIIYSITTVFSFLCIPLFDILYSQPAESDPSLFAQLFSRRLFRGLFAISLISQPIFFVRFLFIDTKSSKAILTAKLFFSLTALLCIILIFLGREGELLFLAGGLRIH